MTLLPCLIQQICQMQPKPEEIKVSKGGKKPPPVQVQLERVLVILEKPLTQREVARLLKISETSAYKYLAELRDMGKVEAEKRKVSGRSYLFWERSE